MAEETQKLPRWKSHKEVEAFKIKDIRFHTYEETLLRGDNCSVVVNSRYMEKHEPSRGGYYVRYADGYESFSPAQAFEEGYISTFPVGVSSENLTANEVKNLRPGPIYSVPVRREQNVLRILARCADCLEVLEVEEIEGSLLNSLMVTVKVRHDCLNPEVQP